MRSNHPWIDDRIRKKVAQRQAVYRDRGRDSVDWGELKDKTDDMISRSKKQWYDKEASRLACKGSHRLAFGALGGLQTKEGKNKWNVLNMRPGASEKEVAEELADHYSKISEDLPHLDMNALPTTYDRPIEDVTQNDVVTRLLQIKKPRSHVSIDLPPKIVNMTANALAPLLTKILHRIRNGEGWPKVWSSEEVTTIPKTRDPEDFNQCRGISCTSIYSKLAEVFMLDILREKIDVGNEQYGGLRGVGTDHMLTEMVTKVLEDMEDNRCAVNVMSIDYQKAFNRMHHGKCLETMARKGSSTQAIKLAATFLGGRTMRAKVGKTMSDPRPTPGGAPQGTKSGNFFFTISIDSVEGDVDVQRRHDNDNETERLHDDSLALSSIFDSETSFNVANVDLRTHGKRTLLDDTYEPDNELVLPQNAHEDEQGFPARWEWRPPWIFKYVDDITTGTRNLIEHGTRHI